jgi:hypothetical protein
MTLGGAIAILATILVGQRLVRSFGIGSKPRHESDSTD